MLHTIIYLWLKYVEEDRSWRITSHLCAFAWLLLPWENIKYYIFWVSVCSLSYPACKAHALCNIVICGLYGCRLRLKCDGARAEIRFRLSAKRTIPFKSAGGVSSVDYWQPRLRISGSNVGYTVFRDSVKGTGYPLHSPVSSSSPPPRASPCAITFQLDPIAIFFHIIS